MINRFENYLQDKLLTVALLLTPVVALLQIVFGMFLDLAMMAVLSGVIAAAAWVEKRQRRREAEAKAARVTRMF